MDTERAVLRRAVSRTVLGESEGGHTQPADGRVEWRRVYALAREHAVVPSLHGYLSDVSVGPQSVRADVAEDVRQQTRRNLRLTEELVQVAGTFEARSIPYLAYKGPALTQLCYGDLSSRQFVDLDILVQDGSVPDARSELRNRGYRPLFNGEIKTELAPIEEKVLRSSAPHYTLVHPEEQVAVELHWQVSPFPIHPVRPDAFDDPRRVQIGGTAIPTLGPETYLLALSLHGAKHHWESLKWVADIASLCAPPTSIDWGSVLRRAENRGMLRAVAITVLLARRLFGFRLPEHTRQRLRETVPDALVSRVQSEFLWNTDESPAPGAGLRLGVESLDRNRHRLWYLFDTLFRPRGREIRQIRLPARLYPLYHLLRPLNMGILGLRLLRYFVRQYQQVN